MLHDIDLRRLSARHGPERAFVSLYLSGPEGLASLKRREDRIRALLEDVPEELVHFEEGMRLVRGWLEEHADGLDEPACVFACWAEDLLEGYRPGVELPDVLRVGPAFYIRPLAELQEERSGFVVVVASNERTRVLTVPAEEIDEEERVRGGVKNRVRKGGWSQKRYARRRENQLLHYAKEVAEVLERLVVDEGWDRVILLGSKETLGEIEEALTPRAAAAIVGRKGIDVHDGDDELLEEAFALFEQEERQSERRRWEEIKSEYLAGGLAAVGPEDVLQAVQLGRADTLVVTRDAKLRGTECRGCENVFAGELECCGACGSDSVFPVDLVDALARQAELTSAEIDFVDRLPGLTKVGDVAALLRY